jgi:hypothetical protein
VLSTLLPHMVAPMPGEFPGVRAELQPQVEDLVARFHDPFKQIDFLRVLVDGRVIGPAAEDVPDVDEATAARMVHPYAWFLDRVGAEGINLTSAGYLPPSLVEAIAAELDLSEEWPGSFNRESQMLPILEFRESAMHVGLLRKYQGKLLLTPSARGLGGDPVALWRYLALSVPLARAVPAVRDAGILLLAAVAGPATDLAGDDPHEYVARMLWVAGWGQPDGTEVTKWQARDATGDTYTVLVRMGALMPDWHGSGPPRPTADGALFARAALRTWPPGGWRPGPTRA